MELTKACSNILSQLKDLVCQLQAQDFVKPTETLSNSTIGQHLRHTLEFFLCLEQGFERGIINYDMRAHDVSIERDRDLALSVIDRIRLFVETLTEKPLRLEVGYNPAENHFITIDTTAIRELVYNIEHAVHHMAIIKIGVREMAGYVKLAPDFGVATSTVRYRQVSSVIAN